MPAWERILPWLGTGGPEEKLIGVLTLLLGGALLWIVVRARRTWGTAEGTTWQDWEDVSQSISVLRQVDLEDREIGPVTRQALRLVLSEEGGYGNTALVPRALEVVRRPFDDAAQELRALGSTAILLGLVYSVFVFMIIFWELHGRIPGLGTETTVLRSIASPLFGHLRFLYLFNGAALLVGVGCQAAGYVVAGRGRKVERVASRALLKLESAPAEGLDPRIARAITKLVEEIRNNFEGMLTDAVHQMGDLSRRMEAIGEQLVQLAEQQGNIVRPLDGIDAVLRAVCEGQENLAKGMKSGLRAIAEPLGLWKPAVDELRGALGALRSAVKRLRPEALEEGQKTIARKIEGVWKSLEEIRQGLSGVSGDTLAPVLKQLGDQLRRVHALLEELARRPVPRPEELNKLLEEIAKTLAEIRVRMETPRPSEGDGSLQGVEELLREILERITAAVTARREGDPLAEVARELRRVVSALGRGAGPRGVSGIQ